MAITTKLQDRTPPLALKATLWLTFSLAPWAAAIWIAIRY